MKMNKKLLSTLTAAALLATAGIATASERYGHQDVVYHINDFERANAALRNIGNHLGATGPENTDLVVVTHSSGINFLLDGAQDDGGNTFDNRVLKLAEQGVEFRICNNTLEGRDLAAEDYSMLADIVEVVPSGVAEVAHLQQEGFVHLKP